MKYQVVCKEGEEWGLYRIAEGWAAALECSVAKEPDRKANANVWVGYSNYGHYAQHHRPTKFDAVLFTHRVDAVKHTGWDRAARYAHLCVCQSPRYAKFLTRKKTVVLHPGFHWQYDTRRKTRFLVMMATHKHGTEKRIKRKRLDWYEQLSAVGDSDWEITGGHYNFQILPGLIDWCDYLVILSDMEGGPLVLGEALARHKPVIAPDVGYCWEWPVLRYTGFDELRSIVTRLCRASDYSMEGDRAKGLVLRNHIEGRLRR